MGLPGVFEVDPTGGGTGGPFGGRSVPPRTFTPPASGASPSAAGPFGSGPNTNPLIAATFAPSLKINRQGIQANTWTPINVDRPTIIWPIRAGLGSIQYLRSSTGLTAAPTDTDAVLWNAGNILFAPWNLPRVTTTLPGGTPLYDEVLGSSGRGLCYLSGPGDWWLYSSAQVEFLQFDAANPVVASRFLGDPGFNGVANYTNTAITAGGAGPVSGGQILPANRYRTALLLQQALSTPGIRIGFGVAPTSDGVSVFTGTRIPAGVNNSILLTGSTCPRMEVYAVTESSAAGALSITEWT